MKYCSIDLETTCLEDKSPENILMISMVVEDTNNLLPVQELPHFTTFIRHKKYVGEAFALGMNSWILDIISGRKLQETADYSILPSYSESLTSGKGIEKEDGWEYKANEFLNKHFGKKDKIVVAGKNFYSFDYHFLPFDLKSRFSHRVLDPCTLYTDFINDSKPADLATCKKRSGIEATVTHDARQDALDVISVLRSSYAKKF